MEQHRGLNNEEDKLIKQMISDMKKQKIEEQSTPNCKQGWYNQVTSNQKDSLHKNNYSNSKSDNSKLYSNKKEDEFKLNSVSKDGSENKYKRVKNRSKLEEYQDLKD